MAACGGVAGCDPGLREATREQIRQAREWTPENQRKYPVEFAQYAVREAEDSLGRLEANRLRLTQHQARIRTAVEESRAKADAGGEALRELKGLYRSADTASSWPVVWRGVSRDRHWVRQNIVKLAGDVRREQEALTRQEAILRKLDTKLEENRQVADRTREALEKMRLARAEIESKSVTRLVEQRVAELAGILKALGGDSTGDNLDDLSDLAVERAAKVPESSFEEIMATP
ncbi:MAG: hypothetical protein N2111_12040 [Candidatus Sumerlaeaceae bacterium]|nr:hypothetical protein [Candidatus Sumerlaeaceae bacterium]